MILVEIYAAAVFILYFIRTFLILILVYNTIQKVLPL